MRHAAIFNVYAFQDCARSKCSSPYRFCGHDKSMTGKQQEVQPAPLRPTFISHQASGHEARYTAQYATATRLSCILCSRRSANLLASVPLAQPSLWPMSQGSCAIARKSLSNPMQMLENKFLSTSNNDVDNGRAARFAKAAVASSRSGKSSNSLNCD